MARLTYAALALAAASLVAGFFVRTTAIPLFASIGLSALVLILIMRGWAKRMRQSEAEGGAEAEDVDARDIVVVDPEADDEEPAAATTRLPRARRSRRADPDDEDLEPADDDDEPRPEPAPELKKDRRRRPAERPGSTEAAKPTRPAGGGRVVVLPGRSRYHVSSCRFARGKGAEEISEATARRRRYRPCSVCLGG